MAIMSARVMRRLAEAADGFRTGEPVWFILDQNDLATVHTAHSEEEALASALEHKGSEIYGPFVTAPDPKATKRVVMITLHFEDGSSVDLDARGVDALFLSNAAREKFVYPYYARVLGPRMAAQMMDEDLQESTYGQHSGSSMYARGYTGHSEPTTYRARGHRGFEEPVEAAAYAGTQA